MSPAARGFLRTIRASDAPRYVDWVISFAGHCEYATRPFSKPETKVNPITSAETGTGVSDCLNCSIRQSVLFAHLQEPDFRDLHQPIDQLNYAAGDNHLPRWRRGAVAFHHSNGACETHTVSSGRTSGRDPADRPPSGQDRCSGAGMHGQPVLPAFHHCPAAYRSMPAAGCRPEAFDAFQPPAFLMTHWHRALSDGGRWIAELLAGTARERVIRLLLWLSEREKGAMDARCSAGKISEPSSGRQRRRQAGRWRN